MWILRVIKGGSSALNFANQLTLLRVLSSALFFLLFAAFPVMGLSPLTTAIVLLVLLVFLEATDALDGYVARKLGQVTDLGKVLDPMADGVARTTVLMAFTQAPVCLPVWLILPFLYRDAMTATLRIVCAWRGIALGARSSGKIKAIVQAATAFFVLVLMIFHAEGFLTQEDLSQAAATAVAFSAAYAVASAAEYLVALRHQLKALLRSPQEQSHS